MDQINIDNQVQPNISNDYVDKGTLFDEIDSLLSGLERITDENTSSSVDTNYKKNSINKEAMASEEEVYFKEKNDVVEKGTKYIETIEQDRMAKVKQKQLLVKLGQDRIRSALEGKSYSRNMDEGLMLNLSKKDAMKAKREESNQDIKTVMKEKIIEDILDVSEELNEEFVKHGKEKFFKKKNSKDSRDNKKKQEPVFQEEEDNEDTSEYDEVFLADITADDDSFIRKFNNVAELEKIINIGEEIRKDVIKTSNERYLYNYIGIQLQQQAKERKEQKEQNQRHHSNSKPKNVQKLRSRFTHAKEHDTPEEIRKRPTNATEFNAINPIGFIQDRLIEYLETGFFKIKSIFISKQMKDKAMSKKKSQIAELKKKINELQGTIEQKEINRRNEIRESKQTLKKMRKMINEFDWTQEK